MSNKPKQAVEEVVVPMETEEVSKPKKTVPKDKVIQLSLDQYFNTLHPEVHAYTRAYVGSGYHGIIKTSKEWDDVLKDKL